MVQKKNKLVSIIIPTFNRAHTIVKTLNSVEKQTYPEWECLIIDDGSSDDITLEIAEYLENDSRFHFFKRPPNKKKGAASCRNIGLKNAKGSYIQFLDSDDLLAENKLKIHVAALEANSGFGLATSKWGRLQPGWDAPRIHQDLPSYYSTDNPLELIYTFGRAFTYFPLHVYLIPKNLIEKAGVWNENLTLNDDGEFLVRQIIHSDFIIHTPETYVIYKTGAGNRLNGSLKDSSIKSYIKAWQLIDENIYSKAGVKNHIFVQQAKYYFYKRLKKHKPEYLQEYSEFFASRMTFFTYLGLKIKNRINRQIFK